MTYDLAEAKRKGRALQREALFSMEGRTIVDAHHCEGCGHIQLTFGDGSKAVFQASTPDGTVPVNVIFGTSEEIHGVS